jgi:nucleotide-binding universal stress UspA family protein
VTGVTVVDVQRLTHIGAAPIGASGVAEELREHRMHVTEEHVEEAIAEFESVCKGAGVAYTVDRETGDAFALMTSLARYHDLMIFGMRGIFDCGLGVDPPDALGRLIGQGVRPIVAVGGEVRPVRKVLAAYSGSLESAKTIKQLIQSQLWPEMSLRIVTCHDDRDKALSRLADIAAYCRAHGFDPETRCLAESPKHEILAHAAEWDADMIVLGNSGRSYLMRKIFGETALHVIQHADRLLFLSQ